MVMVTGLTALFVWLKGRNTERAPASSAMVVSPEDDAAHNVVLVDVRTPEEYRAGHKEGALNIPVDEVEQLAPQLLPDKNAVILLYCRTGKRADKAMETLRKMGYSHLENLHRFEMQPSARFAGARSPECVRPCRFRFAEHCLM